MPVVLADLSLRDGVVIAAGVIVALAALNTVRWLLLRRRRFRIPEEMLVEMNKFASRFQRSARQMTALSRLMEHPARRRWNAKNAEILAILRQMNRLLQHFNDFFEEKVQSYKHDLPPDNLPASDCADPDELARFRAMNKITAEEIARTDWDKLLERLRKIDSPDERK